MYPEIEIISHSPDETVALGKTVGALCQQDLTIALYGDLGSGKTAFVQGLARGLEVPEDYYVTSPSYTIVCEYPGRMPLYHLDLYRLYDVAELEDIGFYDILKQNGVVAIEWAEKLGDERPLRCLTLTFDIIDDSKRKLTINGCGPAASEVMQRLKDKMVI